MGEGELEEGDQKVQPSSYKKKISTKDIMSKIITIVNTAIWHIRVFKIVNSQSSHHKKYFSFFTFFSFFVLFIVSIWEDRY